MGTQPVGELAIQIAIAVINKDFQSLKSCLAWAYGYWDLEQTKLAIRFAIAPLLPGQQQWFYQAVYYIQSGGYPPD